MTCSPDEAAEADHDVSELIAHVKANTSLIQKLRETQVEQGHRLTALDERVQGLEAEVRNGFATIEADVRHGLTTIESEMRGGFATIRGGVTRLTGLLERRPEE